jgi:integrase
MSVRCESSSARPGAPWNKRRIVGQKRPLKPRDVWVIRVRLQMEGRKHNLALFNLAIESKLRACDLVQLRVDDVCLDGRLRERATVTQRKTGRPVRFELTSQTRSSVQDWLPARSSSDGRCLFPSRFRDQPHISTRQHARIAHEWVRSAGLEGSAYGTHSIRRTKAAQIYRKTGNLRADQLLLGHTKLASTVRPSASRSMMLSASPSRWNSDYVRGPGPMPGSMREEHRQGRSCCTDCAATAQVSSARAREHC